ncbi:hypothetical protein [Rufibacter quisquiliarum]|uniref:Uncharacterized protein n=1 Tax=Rufibacter quisquiliarum TaxID=1549639 RepID=A0A839GNV8_9BACT|nr:hypothetical protein [Rufibacter quisquiliarum]MBA9076597.1 hypothetical protein [Rufibacter quisquiliarum]
MKNFTLALLLTLSVAGTSMAKDRPGAKGNTTILSQQFFNSLKLTEMQFIRIKNLEKVREMELREAEAVVASDDLALYVADIDIRFEDSLLKLLRVDQKAAYLEFKMATQKQEAVMQ